MGGGRVAVAWEWGVKEGGTSHRHSSPHLKDLVQGHAMPCKEGHGCHRMPNVIAP